MIGNCLNHYSACFPNFVEAFLNTEKNENHK